MKENMSVEDQEAFEQFLSEYFGNVGIASDTPPTRRVIVE